MLHVGSWRLACMQNDRNYLTHLYEICDVKFNYIYGAFFELFLELLKREINPRAIII